MKNFNIKRFGQVMRWDFNANCHSYIRITLTLTIILAFIYVINLLSLRSLLKSDVFDAADYDVIYASNLTGTTFLIAYFFIIVFCANIFSKCRSKQQRIGLFMLPASNLEKYLTRLLSTTLSNLLVFVVAFLAADLIQYLASFAITPGFHAFLTGNMLENVSEMLSTRSLIPTAEGTVTIYIGAMFLTGLLLIHSTFILGGTFFRRNAPFYTICAHAAIFFAIVTLTASYLASMDDLSHVLDSLPTQMAFNAVIFGVSTVQVAVAALCYWLSYRIFCRMQVINNKWINL